MFLGAIHERDTFPVGPAGSPAAFPGTGAHAHCHHEPLQACGKGYRPMPAGKFLPKPAPAVAAGIFTIAVNTGPMPDKVLADAGANIVLPSMKALLDNWNEYRKSLI